MWVLESDCGLGPKATSCCLALLDKLFNLLIPQSPQLYVRVVPYTT